MTGILLNQQLPIPPDSLPNLLIVDDNEENLILLEEIVKDIRINLIQALSGSDALEKTKGIDLALAILDVRMPGMNGYQLALKINAERLDDKVPVIFLTAIDNDSRNELEGYGSGAVDYIYKPFSFINLQSKVQVFIDLFNQKQTIIRNAMLLKKTSDELILVNATLQQSEAKYKSYIENAPDGVFVADELGRYLEVNEAACNITGYSKEELLKMSIADILMDDTKNADLDHFTKLIETGVLKVDLSYRHTSGAKHWWTLEAVKLSETRFLCFAKDITRRVKLEESLRSHQIELEIQNGEVKLARKLAEIVSRKYTQLFDFGPSGYFTLSAKKKIKGLNLFGALILGKNREILKDCQFDSFISIDTRPVFNSFFKDILKRKTKLTCEIIIQPEDNQPRNVHLEGIFDESNEQCLINVIDISERVKAEAALKEISTRLALATRAGGVGVWDFDLENNKLILDDQMFALYGFEKLDVEYSYDYWLAGIHPDDRARSDAEIKMALNGEQEYDTRFRVVWSDGSIHNIRALADVVKDSNGKPTRLIGTNWDVTEQKRLEEKLKSSESNFRSFFETMTDMVVVGNMLGEIIYVNNSLCSTLGYEDADLLKMLVLELNPLESRAEAQQILNDMIEGKRDYCPLPVVRKNGTYIPVETRAWLGKWNGKPAIFRVSKDISLIKISEEKFSKIFYLNPSACGLTDLTTGKYVEVNEAFYSLFGFDKNEVIGKSAVDLGMLTQENLNSLNLKIGISEKTANLEANLRAKNGDLKDVLLSADNMNIYDKNYRFIVIQDVTRQKITEHTLKISEEKYRTMLNASPDGILLINLKGIITEVSEIGFELFDADNRNDLVGKDFYQFIPPDDANTIKDIFERTVNEGLVQNAELKIRKKGQSTFQSEISSTLIQAPNGEPLSFMIIIRDISQRKKIETKQIHADRMANLGEMASGIAHEINQPLNIISMVMDKILFESDKSETVDLEFLKVKSDKIFDNITRIRNIIDHVRAFSRSDDNYLLTAFDINSSIENAVSMILEQYKHLDINLNTQLNRQIPPIIGNTYKFEQVIVNLLTNAKDAVLERRRRQDDYCELKVEIRTYQENQSLIVEITDNGTGIDKDDIQNIMLPFYTTKDEGKGTGLGLSICYQIIKEMNGTIEIISEEANETKIKLVLDIQKN